MKIMNASIKEGKGVEDKKKNRKRKKIALTLSVCLLIIWSMLGTSASLAWFEDEDQVRNIFHIAKFGLEVSYETPEGKWEDVTGETKIFDDSALYEPGYTQVVYLKAKNASSVPVDFNIAVGEISRNYEQAYNVYGDEIFLKEYLQFGVVIADTYDNLVDKIKTRDLAKNYATEPLNEYFFEDLGSDSGYDTSKGYSYFTTDTNNSLGVDEEKYIALIVYMPEDVGNEANYRGDTIPQVELGIVVSATQQKNN